LSGARVRALGALLGLCAIGASPAAASAHSADEPAPPPESGQSERQLRAYETATLGPEHAAEHARQRAVGRRAIKRWRRMSPARRRRALARRRAKAVALARATARDPATEIGRWTAPPFSIPTYAINLAVLPTGKTLFWSYPPRTADGGYGPNVGTAALWDPSKGYGPAAIKNVPPPPIDVDGDGDTEPAPLWCSGQSFLPNGTVLVTGGNLAYTGDPGFPDDFAGHNRIFTFDPWTESWTEQPPMENGRWYPTQTLLGDGRTLILGGIGEDQPGGIRNTDLEVFTPPPTRQGRGGVQRAPSGDRYTGLYPRMFGLPNGEVLLAGPWVDDSAILHTGSLTWEDLPSFSRHRQGGQAVMMPGGPGGSSTAVQFGGFDFDGDTEFNGDFAATATSEAIDGMAASPTPVSGPSFNYGRSFGNVVILPDGSMVAIGGARGSNPTDGLTPVWADGRLRRVELYDPATGAWKLGPAQLEDRTYHSTAALLPNGQVMSAGDDTHPHGPGGTPSTADTAEIYSPPYLFRKGKRPRIRRIPRVIAWGRKFGIKSESRKLRGAVLMAPAATTHSFDASQRRVPLRVIKRSKGVGITVKAPSGPLVAPPGYYMLFLLNARGEPSKARWVQLGATPVGGNKKQGKTKGKKKGKKKGAAKPKR
jgi:galactose oxidase-like protein